MLCYIMLCITTCRIRM